MFLRERLRALRAQSLSVWVLLAMVSTLSLSFLAFHLIANHVQSQRIDPTFDSFDEIELESARAELQSGGKPALKEYLTGLDGVFKGSLHYLLDARGNDVLTGQSRAELLPVTPAVKSRARARGHWIISHRSQDGQYWFAVEGQYVERLEIWTFLPYYFLVIGATGILCWMAYAGVVSPILKIAGTITQFGEGDLAARVQTRRNDEIGRLGRSFNRTAERLERLIKSERRLLGDISHELRSPLARLKFAIKLARTSSDTNAALDRIERDVNRITSLVADIVEITLIEGDSTVREMGNVRLGEIVGEVVRDCSLEAQFRGSSIDVVGKIRSEVTGDRELLRRAIENVLRNGIRYAPGHSIIQLCMEEKDRDATITVRDQGPGVPEEALARIFDPFFRVEEARDTQCGGSGMGLSIAKRAVQLHRGEIIAENASPGLRVRIAIPLAESSSIEANATHGAELGGA
jgi:signal transduction histidine kinase